MSIALPLFRFSKPAAQPPAPLTNEERKIQRLQAEIDECKYDKVRAFNRYFTNGMTRVTELIPVQVTMLAKKQNELETYLKELQSGE